MRFDIISRMNTRSTSYTKRSVIAVLSNLNLVHAQEGIVLKVEVPSEVAPELERQLQLIDRNIAYRKVL